MARKKPDPPTFEVTPTFKLPDWEALKGFRLDPDEVIALSDLMGSDGWKVAEKIWEWQDQHLLRDLLAAPDGCQTGPQNRFLGFQWARTILKMAQRSFLPQQAGAGDAEKRFFANKFPAVPGAA